MPTGVHRMDKYESQNEKPISRPADKPDPRHVMDTRYQEGITWRNGVRTEDVEWRTVVRREDVEVRETARKEDKEWREVTRKEDKEWREVMRREDLEWREIMRREDLEWRTGARSDDRQYRLRTERIMKRCAALSAAAQTSKGGSSLDAILALAQQLEDWLNSEDR